jgi:hypothetical protein
LIVSLRRLIPFLLVCVTGVGLAACDRYGDDIDAVKTADSVIPGKANDILAIDIAGARGTIDWQGAPAPQYQSDDIVAVAAVIKRISAAGNRHQIELDFIHNRQTRKVAFDGALVDGKKQDLVSGALNLFMMQLE